MEHDIFRAMNTTIIIAAHDRLGFQRAHEYILAGERRFTRFSEESELSQLNRSAGGWFEVSEEMLGLLRVALGLHERTLGWFNPAVLPALERMGYSLSFELLKQGAPGLQAPPALPVDIPPFAGLELDEANRRVRLPRGMRLDLGGIAKGWIAERAALLLAQSSPYCAVNAGGDIYLHGLPNGLSHWEVGLEDPQNPDVDLTTLTVEPGALATSSTTRRTWLQGDIRRHHLINPHSGAPAESPWLQVTAFAAHTAEAEAFAKAILVGGPEAARQLAGANPNLNYLAVDAANMLYFPQNGEIECVQLMN